MKFKNLTFKLCIIFFLSMLFLSCKKKVQLENEAIFKSFISEKTHTNLAAGKTAVFILQNSDCICTDDNIKFTLDVTKSKKYSDYKKILIVLSPTHKIIPMAKKINLRTVSLTKDDFYNNGLLITTDRVFLFDGGQIEQYSDMHTVSPGELRKDYL